MKPGIHFYVFVKTTPLQFGGKYEVGIVDTSDPTKHNELVLNSTANYLWGLKWSTNYWLWLSDCNDYDNNSGCCLNGAVYLGRIRMSSLWQIFYDWMTVYDTGFCNPPHDNPHDLNGDKIVNFKDYALLAGIYKTEMENQ